MIAINKKQWIIGGAALLLIIIVVVWMRGGKSAIVYREVKVERGNLQATVLSTGIVQPENRLEIKPPIAGRAEQVLVEEGDVVKKGKNLFWMSSTERAALLDAARARGPGELARWEEFYKPTPVLAPIDGTIILRSVEPGQTFTSADAVLIMSDRLTVQAQVDETDIAEIHLQQKASVILDAYPDQVIPATVNKIAYDAKTVNNVTTYIVDVLPDETPAVMKSGMTANISFVVGTKDNVLIIPSDAVKSHDGKAFVLVKNPNKDKPIETEIKMGLSNGKQLEVVSGLNEGDIVVISKRLGGKSGGSSNSGGTNPFSPYGNKPKPQGK